MNWTTRAKKTVVDIGTLKRWRAKDGPYAVIEIQGTPYHNDDGRPVTPKPRFVAIRTDPYEVIISRHTKKSPAVRSCERDNRNRG